MALEFDGNSMFKFQKSITIPKDCEVVVVADLFAEEYIGGAELTTDALIESSPFKVFKLHSSDVTMSLLEQGYGKFWIFGNYTRMDHNLIPSIVANLQYAILEYDYKFCRHRSPQKHLEMEGVPCNCETEQHGQLTSAFFFGARSLWMMSEAQRDEYCQRFPSLVDQPITVLSSVFDDDTFAAIKLLRARFVNQPKAGWIVLDSPSWVKGADAAKQWCQDNNIEYTPLWNAPYEQVLTQLATAEGFVYLPRGYDTCPRMVIEAKLLGCKLILNENVQHANEEWFASDDIELIESYLYMARQRFWNGINADMGEQVTTLSGYTTTYNCIKNDYPFIESIRSMLAFCDEVVVVDAGSTDGTWESIKKLQRTEDRLIVHQEIRDRSKKRWAIDFDGKLKAIARSMCSKVFCWQQDVDEIVHEDDYGKIKQMVKFFPKGISLLCLPVIEYWGHKGKVRCDIHNWKWRLSRNLPGLTHGIPKELRQYDSDGELYAAQGTDSCDYIWLHDYSRVPSANFCTNEVNEARLRACAGDVDMLAAYEKWYNEIVTNLPGVQHYSWFNIERKIETYRAHWSSFWASMYDHSPDTATVEHTNVMFERPWNDVTAADVKELATRLEDEKGGWIFHQPVDWSRPSVHITCTKSHPAIILDWVKEQNNE